MRRDELLAKMRPTQCFNLVDLPPMLLGEPWASKDDNSGRNEALHMDRTHSPPCGLVPRVWRHRRYSSSRAKRLASRRANDSHGKERSGIRLFLQKIQGRHQCVSADLLDFVGS